jgi:hypothetical protein
LKEVADENEIEKPESMKRSISNGSFFDEKMLKNTEQLKKRVEELEL